MTTTESTEPITTSSSSPAETTATATPDAAVSTPAEASPSPGPWHQLMDGTGSFKANWARDLPDALQPFAGSVGNFRNLDELIKGYGRLKSRLGKAATATFVPGEGAAEEEISAYRQAIGVPASAEDYGLRTPPEGMEEGYDTDFGARVEEVLHRHHVPGAAAQELRDLEMQRAAAQAETLNTEDAEWRQSQDAKLQEQWGKHYDVRRTEAARAAQAFGLDLATADDADIAMAFARIHRLLGEDGTVQRAAALDPSALHPAGANPQSRAHDIMTNPANPLYNRYTDGDREIRGMVHSLLRG